LVLSAAAGTLTDAFASLPASESFLFFPCEGQVGLPSSVSSRSASFSGQSFRMLVDCWIPRSLNVSGRSCLRWACGLETTQKRLWFPGAPAYSSAGMLRAKHAFLFLRLCSFFSPLHLHFPSLLSLQRSSADAAFFLDFQLKCTCLFYSPSSDPEWRSAGDRRVPRQFVGCFPEFFFYRFFWFSYVLRHGSPLDALRTGFGSFFFPCSFFPGLSDASGNFP